MMIVLGSAATVAAYVSQAGAQTVSDSDRRPIASHRSIEGKATLVKPDDPSSVAALVEEVFNFPRAYPRLPTVLEATIKDRLAQAEMSYIRGGTPAVKEEDIVKLVNNMATKFGAPDYVRTTARQLRFLRMSLALVEPKFMGAGVARQSAKIGDPIGSSVSPLQAAHLLAALVDQKFLNPDFQVSPADWDRAFDPSSIDKLDAARRERQGAAASQEASKSTQIVARVNPKRMEMNEFLSQQASSVSWDDAWVIVQEAFTTLGIR
jgi:hypothetical protein